MVRRTDIIMALDGMLYDIQQRKETHTSVETLSFLTERITHLKKTIILEKKYNERSTK